MTAPRRKTQGQKSKAGVASAVAADPSVNPAFDQFRSELWQCMPAAQDARSELIGR